MTYFLYVASWLILGWIASRMALRRGRNPNIWFMLGVVLGVIAIAILFFLPRKQTLAPAAATPPSAPAIDVTPTQGSANRPPEKLWYYLDKEKKRHGPMSFYALQEAWHQKTITEATFLWNDEMENWERLRNLEALKEKISSPS